MATETPSPARQLIGDVAPKLVQLTDDVLFGARSPPCVTAARHRRRHRA